MVMPGGDHQRQHDPERGGEDDQHRNAAQVGAKPGGGGVEHDRRWLRARWPRACGMIPGRAMHLLSIRILAAALVTLALAGCGSSAPGPVHATLRLDFVPNAVHARLY